MIPITTILNSRTLEVQVYPGHLLDGDLHKLGKTLAHGHVFYFANEMPSLFHLHSKEDNHLHMIITHTHVIELSSIDEDKVVDGSGLWGGTALRVPMPTITIDTPATPGKHCCLPENGCLANVDGQCQCECCPSSC